ncbi:phosphoglycerate dehydrogenase [Ruminococcaceae bacterium OttesenSCG-928-A16]|nr:phosphoglycerate dehydrogenase [Ruminococcaceae bacterium OttesenSCG-928-A16]
MFIIQTRNSISAKGLERLPSSLFTIEDDAEAPQGVLVRSANMLEDTLPESLLAIARAGAGTNNVPVERCTNAGVVVFNTPGANANAVKELVLGGLVLASRNVAGGIAWASTLAGQADAVPGLVEKGKSKFAGPELAGKTLGVVGLGAIGAKVANMATHLGMEVLGYDPFISVEAAWNLSRSVKHCINLADIITKSDYISLHLPVNKDTKGILNTETIAQLKPGARILNFARGELVDNPAMLAALKNGRVAAYVTDFPSDDLIGKPGVVCIPHLGASTPESEENCALMAAEQMKDYLLNGNITNSVNLPNISLPRTGGSRVCVVHQNTKGMLAGLTAVLNGAGLNIENLTNKSRGEVAYTMLDLADHPADAAVQEIQALEGVIRVRVV